MTVVKCVGYRFLRIPYTFRAFNCLARDGGDHASKVCWIGRLDIQADRCSGFYLLPVPDIPDSCDHFLQQFGATSLPSAFPAGLY